MTLGKAIVEFLQVYFVTFDRSRKTHAAYSCDLHQFETELGNDQLLAAIAEKHIVAWFKQLRCHGYASASLRRKKATLNVFFRYWVQKGALAQSPFAHLRFDFGHERRLTPVLSVDHVCQLLKTARQRAVACRNAAVPRRKEFLAMRNLAIVETLFTTGIRVGELTSLAVGDVDLPQQILCIKGKGRRQRLAFLHPLSSRALEDYLRLRGHNTRHPSALFLNTFGGALTTQGVSDVLRGLASEAGLQRHVTPHMLRHTVATMLLHNGADIRIVQEFLGHSRITMTERYLHVSRKHLAAKLKQFHPRNGLDA